MNTTAGSGGGRRRMAWFNCCAGVAGDMVLAALVDAGADADDVAAAIAALDLDGYAMGFEAVQRGGIAATWFNLVIETDDVSPIDHDHQHEHQHDHDHQHEHQHGHDHQHGHEHEHEHGGHHVHRPAREVIELIERADLPTRVKDRAIACYRRLAEVEGQVHGIDADEVELHEVGAIDSIIDVVGVCAALESLDIEAVVCSPIAVGHGTVNTAHGRLPNPVPAVTLLLANAGCPVVGLDTTMEVTTPTGAALMVSLADQFGALPQMVLERTGFGAGTADPPGRPNVVQVVIGETVDDAAPTRPGRPAHLIETNVDDVSGEVLAHTISALMAAGAHDAWVTPIVMKKGRPAHIVSAVCDDGRFELVAATMLAETGSLGLRSQSVQRWPATRSEQTALVDGHPIRAKITDGRIKIEHDDAVAAATALGLPLRIVLARAEQALNPGP